MPLMVRQNFTLRVITRGNLSVFNTYESEKADSIAWNRAEFTHVYFVRAAAIVLNLIHKRARYQTS